MAMEESISISKFKATCLSVLSQVEVTGRKITVTKRGKPIACIIPAPPAERGGSFLGCMRGKGAILGDIAEPLDVQWEALK